MPNPEMSTNNCAGYRWNEGQYTASNCSQESSTFFIIIGFTMLALVLFLVLMVIIACLRRQRLRTRAGRSPPLAAQENEDDCVINFDGQGPTGDPSNGRNLENVKTVIMAGEEKPTYIAHPVSPSSPSSELSLEEEQEVNSDEPARLAVVQHEGI